MRLKPYHFILVFFIFTIVLTLLFFLPKKIIDDNNNVNNKNNEDSIRVDSGSRDNNGVPDTKDNVVDDVNNDGEVEGGVEDGGGGGGGGEDSGDDNGDTFDELEDNRTACMVVRPGNIPDVLCYVNYIGETGVSVSLKNKLGEEIDATINLNTCSPEVTESINNNQEKEFVFSCNNYYYFKEAIFLSYTLSGDRVIEVGGFVSGFVE